ncbi:hypothetical protein GGI06_000102 [Coemansia sp. S85]|nr:hypothetical protein GGI06_000102 [Coemansia sp. S85]
MGEAINLHEINSGDGGSADKEQTATAAVHSALKLIDESARQQQQQQYGGRY